MCDFRVIENDFANDTARCVCKGAVLSAYETLSSHGHKTALAAAMKIYQYHHPGDSAEDTQITIERWIVAQTNQIH